MKNNKWRIKVSGICILLLLLGGFILKNTPHKTVTTDNEVKIAKGKKVDSNSDGNTSGEGNTNDYTIKNASQGIYDLNLKMDKNGKFSVKANIEVKNKGEESWDNLVFYFIPNVFTKENKPEKMKSAGTVHMQKVTLDGSDISYTLDKDTLLIKLTNKMVKGESHQVSIQYQFTVPDDGFRFTKTKNGNYHLAQWYPMLAYYTHGWLKHPYMPNSETYHTAHTDFTLSYQIPKGYIFTSTAPNENSDATSGEVKANNVKEMFVGILKNQEMQQETIDGIQIRVFAPAGHKQVLQKSFQTVKEVVHYYNQKIGKYPYPQLDVLLEEDSDSMEYPEIVTVGITDDQRGLNHTIAHEIAHQWFYGMVSEDPYTDGWLDEGLAELTAALYCYLAGGESAEKSFELATNLSNAITQPGPSNLPLDQFPEYHTYSYLYGQPVIMLKELFEEHGGLKNGFKFLAAYFNTYKFKEVNTNEFVHFAETYYHLKNRDFFMGWLDINKEDK
ncbi:M1 family metallopeptidase [Heyndrickxia sp. NPDC080065]|uniref:M1 family metallopeptidase n=1 Tax=Heyndrickxia sp. NPDC080065 TaxID=3390568 RepID=UPI003CFC8175